MKNQVLSIEQMRKLKELGVDTSKASMHFLYMPTAKSIMSGVYEVDDEPEVFVSQNGMNHEHPTFTLQDIIELLTDGVQKAIVFINNEEYFVKCYEIKYDEENVFKIIYFDNIKQLLNACYEMLIWVAENGYLKTK